MNKILLISIIVVVAIGTVVLLNRTPAVNNISTTTQYNPEQTISIPQTNTTDEAVDQPPSGASGDYKEYSESVYQNASQGKRVLFFYASWCPTCRPADADFQNNTNKIPSDVTVIRVNYNDPETDNEEKALAEKYGVTYQHTYVQIDSAGKEIGKWNGGALEELITNLK